MRTSHILITLSALALSACGDDYFPREKVAQYNPETGQIEMPYPCPDWSHSSAINYDNSPHSNFGCAIATDTAEQIAYPEDIAHGSSAAPSGPDTEITSHVVEQYRKGEIPQPLTPQQGSAATGSQ